MSHRYRRHSKRELLGSLQVDYTMSVSDLGLLPGTNRWEVLRAFLNRGEARAERLVEERDGFLILQSIPGRRNTGAIYLYRESLQAFFWLTFGNREDDLNGEDFQNALRIHRLIGLVGNGARPRHPKCLRRGAGSAVASPGPGFQPPEDQTRLIPPIDNPTNSQSKQLRLTACGIRGTTTHPRGKETEP